MTAGASDIPAPAPSGWRLATRITAIVLGSLVPLVLIVGLSYSQATDQRRADELDGTALVGQTVAAVVDGFSRDIEGTMLAAALALGRQDVPISQATAGPYLDALLREYPELRAIFVVDLTGRVVAAQRGEGVGTNLGNRPYLEALRNGAEVVWTPGLVGSQSREITIVFARTIRDQAGAHVASLVAAYYPPQLIDRLAIMLPPDADIAFYDRNGLLLHSTARPDMPFERRDASRAPRLQTALATGQPVRLDGPSTLYDDEPRFGTLVPVPRIGWVIAFTRPLRPLERQLQQQLFTQLTGVTIVVLLVATILAILTRRLMSPVGALARAAGAIARGERPRVPRFDSDPDVSQLAHGMAAMSRAVAEREDDLQSQSARLDTLAEASRAFAEAGLDAQAVLDAVVRTVANAVGDGCAAMLVSPDGQHLELAAIHHPDEEALALAKRLVDQPRPIDQGLARQLIHEQQPLLIPIFTPEMVEAMVRPESREYTDRFGLHSLAAVPLRVRERTFGAVMIWRGTPGRPYGSADLRLLEDIADRAGLAIDNAQLFMRREEARRSAEQATERTQRLQEITARLAGSLEAEDVLGLVARSAAELIDTQVGAVFLMDSPEDDFDLAAAFGVEEPLRAHLRLPRHASLAGRAVDQGRTLVADDVRETPGTALPRLLTGQTVGSEMAAPITVGAERIGVVKVFSPRVRRFAPDDVALLTALAAAAAVALNNARLYREVREAVAARDEFLSVAAHELKTPVTSVKGIAQLVARAQERGQLTDERLTRLMAMMSESSSRLGDLVDDLLDVSRIQSGQLALRVSTIDLAELVGQIATARSETLDPDHRLETALPDGCVVEADPDRMRQVVENLVDNAVKYSPDGGSIRVALSAPNGRAELSVADEGIGLPPGAETSIFEPFGRAPNATARALPGMGLGLYICRNIVERHGGRIWAESEGEGKGTTVKVEIPR